jgi:predicted N-acetyltransferase YhbS
MTRGLLSAISSVPHVNPAISIVSDDATFDPACEALYARAFGPGRYAKAAARLREGNVCRRDLSVLAFDGSTLIGACRLWSIEAENGEAALFLGPVAVDQAARQAGLGQQLVKACLAQVDAQDFGPVILVGDLGFFGRMGFEIVPSGHIIMPTPVDPNRLLWRLKDTTVPLPQGRLSVPHATMPAG